MLLNKTKIKQIFVTGKTAEKLYNRFILKSVNIPCISLPSTSSANQTITYDEIKNKYKIIKNYLN